MEREGRAVGAASGELVTIGEFARLSRLSAKALRRYDELGLFRPALVDPVNGYRYYDPAQVEGARLVAWLRRIGMPLNRIGRVVALDAGAAAVEVRAYWARVEAETAARRDLRCTSSTICQRRAGRCRGCRTTQRATDVRGVRGAWGRWRSGVPR